MEELQKLYNVLSRDGYYTKSFEEFQVQYDDPAYRDKVFELTIREGLYTNSREEFDIKYSVKKKDETIQEDMDSVSVDTFLDSPSGEEAAPPVELTPEQQEAEWMNAIRSGEEVPRDKFGLPDASQYSGSQQFKSKLGGGKDGGMVADNRPEMPEAVREEYEAGWKQRNLDSAEALKIVQADEVAAAETLAIEKQDAANRLSSDPEFLSDVELITPNLVGKTEEEVVPELNEKFGKYGFLFKESGLGDNVTVTTVTGDNSYTFNLDAWTESGEIEGAENIKRFIKTHAVDNRVDTEVSDFVIAANRAQNLRDGAYRDNGDGTVSTVKMMSFDEDGKFYAAPTLFPKDPENVTSASDSWKELPWREAIEVARNRGELFQFETEEEAEDFAEGGWKNISNVDLEGQKFYADRGFDYNSERKARDNYNDALEELMFIEEAKSNMSFDYGEDAEKYPDLFVNGQLRRDYREVAEELQKKVDGLYQVAHADDEKEQLREEFDLYLAKRQQGISAEAAKINKEALNEGWRLQDISQRNLGINLSELNTYVPKNEREEVLLDNLKVELAEVNYNIDLASDKYLQAQTFYSAKDNKNIYQEFSENWDAFSTEFWDGIKRGQAMDIIMKHTIGITGEEDAEERAAKVSEYLASVSGKQSRVLARFEEARGFRETMEVFTDNPYEMIGTWFSSSISMMLPMGLQIVPAAVVAGGTAGLAGGPLAEVTVPVGMGYGAMTGMAATNFWVEYTNAFLEAVANNPEGYNPLDGQDMLKAFQNPEVWAEANDRGVKRGLAIATMDFVGMAVAGRLFSLGRSAVTRPAKLIGLGAAERLIADPAIEATGEILAQISVGDDLRWKEVMAEAGGAIGNNSAPMAIRMLNDTRKNNHLKIADNLTSLRFMAMDNGTSTQIMEWTNNMKKLGRIDEKTYGRILENIGLRDEARSLLNTGTKRGAKKTGNTAVESRIMELLSAREQLSSTTNRSEVFRKELGDIREEINFLVKNKELVESDTAVDLGALGLEVGGRRSSKNDLREGVDRYSINGKLFTRKGFMKAVENLTQKQLLKYNIIVSEQGDAKEMSNFLTPLYDKARAKLPELAKKIDEKAGLRKKKAPVSISVEQSTEALKNENELRKIRGEEEIVIDEKSIASMQNELAAEIQEYQDLGVSVRPPTENDVISALLSIDVSNPTEAQFQAVKAELINQSAQEQLKNKKKDIISDTKTETETETETTKEERLEARNKDLFSETQQAPGIPGRPTISDITTEGDVSTATYTNESGETDVIISSTGTTNNFVGFFRVYEDGKPTNKWTSKMEVDSGVGFSDMITKAQEALPPGHQWTESKSISKDGLRVWNNSSKKGYTAALDSEGNVITKEVTLNKAKKGETTGESSDYNTEVFATREAADAAVKELQEIYPGIKAESKRYRKKSFQVKIQLPVLVRTDTDTTTEVDAEAEVEVDAEVEIVSRPTKKDRDSFDAGKLGESRTRGIIAGILQKEADNKKLTPFQQRVKDESSDLFSEMSGAQELEAALQSKEAPKKKPAPKKKGKKKGGANLQLGVDPKLSEGSKRKGLRKAEKKKAEDLLKKVQDDPEAADLLSEEVFTAENPAPGVTVYTVTIKENSKLANKVRRMGLDELVGKKINLVMADQLVVNDDYMGGPLFALQDKLFGKVAWASMDLAAARKIIKGAIDSDYSVVYNMAPNAIVSNTAFRQEFLKAVERLSKKEQKKVFAEIKKFGKKTGKDNWKALIAESKNLEEFLDEMSDFNTANKRELMLAIMPTESVKASLGINSLLEGKGITVESILSIITEDMVNDLPAGALLTVLNITDKNGNKVTAETAEEAIMTPEQQKEEGIPEHPNYPIYLRGNVEALMSETTPFWNVISKALDTINKKVAGIIKKKSSTTKKYTEQYTSKETLTNELYQAQVGATESRQTNPLQVRDYRKFVSLLQRSFPNVEVLSSQEEFDNLVLDLRAKKLITNKSQKVYGAVYGGKLYLNPELENYNTPIHEFGHIWMNVAKQLRPDLYRKGITLIENSPYITEVKNSKEYKAVLKSLVAEGYTPEEIQEYIREEALAMAIGDKGAAFVNATQQKNFKDWIKKLYNFVRNLTGLSKYTPEQLQDITLDEFVQGVVVDIISGEQVFKDSQMVKFKGQMQLMTGETVETATMWDIISTGRDMGLPDSSIRAVLESRNFGKSDINEALIVPISIGMEGETVIPPQFGQVNGGMKEGGSLFTRVTEKLRKYAAGSKKRKSVSETSAQKTKRAQKIREAKPSLAALTDAQILKRFPNLGVETVMTKSAPTMAEVRAKALELLKADPVFQSQSEIVQIELISALDSTIGTRANLNIGREVSALRKRLKDFKAGVDSIQKVKQDLRNFIRKALPTSGQYTSATVNKILSSVARVNEKNFLREVDKIMDVVDSQREKVKQGIIGDMRSLSKRSGSKNITDSNRARSKGIYEVARLFFENVSSVLNMDDKQMDALGNRVFENEAEIAEIEGRVSEGKYSELTAKEQQMLAEAQAYDMFSGIEDMTVEEVKDLLREMRDIRRTGRMIYQSRRGARRAKLNDINKEAEEQIKEEYPQIISIDGNPMEGNELRASSNIIREAFGESFWEGVKAVKENFSFTTAKEFFSMLGNNLKHLGTVANQLDMRGSFFTDQVYKRLNRMEEQYLQGYFESYSKLDDMANSIDGITDGYSQILSQLYGAQDTKKSRMGIAKNPILTISNLVKSSRSNPEGKFVFNKDSATRIYALSLNARERARLQKLGLTDTKLEEIKDFIGPQLIEFTDRTVDFLSNEYYNGINNIYTQVNDVSLGYIENYFPTQSISEANIKDLLEGRTSQAQFSAETATALRERQSKTEISYKGGFSDTLEDHLKTMERYKAYAEGTKTLVGIFNNKYVRGVLAATGLGPLMHSHVAYAINPDSAVNQQMNSPIMEKIQNKYTGVALALRIMQIVKQATSFVQAIEDYQFIEGKKTPVLDPIMFMLEAAFLAANLGVELAAMATLPIVSKLTGKETKFEGPLAQAIGMSASFKNRLKMGLKGDIVGLAAGSPTFAKSSTNTQIHARITRGSRKAFAAPTVVGDVAGVMGYMVNYRRNIKNGMSEAEALEAFNEYNATQQSRRPTEKVAWQQSGTISSRAFTMFGSTLFLQMNKVIQAANNLSTKGRTTQQKIKDVRALSLNLAIANVLFVTAANIFKLTQGDDDDKQEVYIKMKDAMVGLNQLYQVPFLGPASEELMSGDVRNKQDAIVNPLQSMGRRYMQRIEYDDYTKIESAVRGLTEISMGVNVDPAVGLYEYFGGESTEEQFMYDLLGVSRSYRPNDAK